MMEKATITGNGLKYKRYGQGEPLLLLHGYPLDHSIWEPTAKLLENDFNLILPDLPGFGKSHTLAGECTLKGYTDAILGLLDALQIERAYLCGHSMGGYIALAFACLNPQRLRGLCLVASQAIADTPEKREARLQQAERVLVQGVGEVVAGMPALLTVDVTLQEHLRQLILEQSPQGVAWALRAMATRGDSISCLKELNMRVAIIHGRADKIIPIEKAQEMHQACRDGNLATIEGAGHMPMMETPLATAEVIRSLRAGRRSS